MPSEIGPKWIVEGLITFLPMSIQHEADKKKIG